MDSAAFLGILNDSDSNHSDAILIWRRASYDRLQLVTTNFVVAEAHALILGRLGYGSSAGFLRETMRSSMLVERAGVEDEAAARQIIFRYADKRFSLVDAISFAVMERLGIRTAFTFDRNFTQYGFEVAVP
jgi:predicted nucleic acid-binding protein